VEPTLYRPSRALERFVKYFWTFELDQGDAVWTLLMFATGISGILFQHHTGRSAAASIADGHSVKDGRCPTSFMYGRRTRPVHTFTRGPFALTGVVFKSQGLSTLLNTQVTSFHDRSVELGDFSKEIGEQLLDARAHRERVVLLSEVLQRHVDGSGSEDVLVTESLRLIRKDIRSIRVPRLLKCLNLSERQFERRFVRAIGIPPHQYIRIVRFREAIRLIKRTQFERLSDIAYDLNYVDQSHFIKEIKALSGYAPKRLVQTVRTGVELPCALILEQGIRHASQPANNFLASHRASVARCGPSTSEPAMAPSKSTIRARAVAFASFTPAAFVHSRKRSANHSR
jgi:AraC-like DNA-binding protein